MMICKVLGRLDVALPILINRRLRVRSCSSRFASRKQKSMVWSVNILAIGEWTREHVYLDVITRREK